MDIKFRPKEELYLATELNAAEIQRLLNQNITPATDGVFARLFDNGKFFDGTAHGKRFVIKRNIHYRNIYLPVINGVIDDSREDLTYLHLKISITGGALAANWLAFVLVGLLAVSFTVMVFIFEANPDLMGIYLVMLVFYAYTMVAYNYESDKAKIFLMNLLDALQARKPQPYNVKQEAV